MFLRKREAPRTPASELERVVDEQLPDADADTRALVVAITGLLACVAFADREYTPAEHARAQEVLGRIQGLSPAGVTAIADAMRAHGKALAFANSQQHTRSLRELADVSFRREVLEALLDLAAADGELAMVETDMLRRAAAAMGLSQDDYLAAQSRHRDRLSVLK